MSIRLIGEGGSVFTFDLPLHETMQDKLARRELRPADEESAQAVAEMLDDSEPEEPEPVAPAGVAAHVDMSASVKNILEAVDSPEVAEAVLEAELSADEPRTTLLDALGELLED